MNATRTQKLARTVALLTTLSGAVTTQCVLAQNAAPDGMPGGPPGMRRAPAYLGADAPDADTFMPPPPAADSVEGKAELQIYHETRALEGSARWDMAASDAQGDAGHMWEAFSCALGAEVSPDMVPKVANLIQRTMADVSPIVGQKKNFYDRPRPFTVAEGNTCVPSENLASNGAYPSGHATIGWTWALVLAELAPDRAGELVGRGRAYGESRVVCGVHYPSDVWAGQTVSTAVVMALQGNTAYVADREAARAELNLARAAAARPDAARCELEATLVRTKPW